MQRIVVGNERDNPDLPRVQVIEDFRTVRKLDGDIYMFNEIYETEDHEDLRRVFPLTEWIMPFVNGNPILLKRSRFVIRNALTHEIHKGEAGFTPRRFVNSVEYRLRRRPLAKWNALSCGHLINRAWNGKEKDPRVEKRRQELWTRGWEVWNDVADSYYRRGITHTFGGDFNRLNVPKFSSNQQWVNGTADIIKIGVIHAPRGNYVKNEGSGSIGLGKLHTDHPYRWNDLTFTRTKRS